MPTILMPTRITANTAILIDHIYYSEGRNNKSITTKSGNFLTDITDHLPNYRLLINNKKIINTIRPMTRISSENNKNNFVGELCHIKWDHLFMQTDPNLAYVIYLVILLLHYLTSIFLYEENPGNLRKTRDG